MGSPQHQEHRAALHPRRALRDAGIGLALAIALTVAVGVAAARFWIVDSGTLNLLGYLSIWVPLLGAVLIGCLRHGSGSVVRDLGLRMRPLDILWGLSIGLLARVFATLVEVLVYGQPAQPLLGFDVVRDLWWVFIVVLAPVVITPVVEELFFRGLALRAALARFGSPTAAVLLSALLFAVIHLPQAAPGAGMFVITVVTFVFGLALATLAVFTGRLGGAMIAHVTFNALAVIPAVM